MKVLSNHILVRVEKKQENTVVAPGGTEFHFDGSFEEQKSKRIYGEVVGVPDKLTSSEEIWRIEDSVIQTRDSYPYTMPVILKVLDIQMDVKIGDKVYFYYLEMDDINTIEIKGEELYQIPYQSVICCVRDKEIIPIGGHTLVEPHYGKDVEKGQLIKKGSIIIDQVTEPVPRYGIVKYVSAPLGELEVQIKRGDFIIFEEYANFLIKIEGREFYCMRYFDAVCLIEEI